MKATLGNWYWCDDNFYELLVNDGRGDFSVHQLIESNDTAETRNRIGRKCIQIGLAVVTAHGDTTGIGVFDDDAGRLLAKLIDTFQGGIRIVDVVIGEFLTLDLFSGGNTCWFGT